MKINQRTDKEFQQEIQQVVSEKIYGASKKLPLFLEDLQ